MMPMAPSGRGGRLRSAGEVGHGTELLGTPPGNVVHHSGEDPVPWHRSARADAQPRPRPLDQDVRHAPCPKREESGWPDRIPLRVSPEHRTELLPAWSRSCTSHAARGTSSEGTLQPCRPGAVLSHGDHRLHPLCPAGTPTHLLGDPRSRWPALGPSEREPAGTPPSASGCPGPRAASRQPSV